METQWQKKYIATIAVLEQCSEVTKHDSENHKEAETIAHAFIDIEESFQKIFNTYLPELLREKPSKTNDLLEEIGEEFRHILYHINAPKFYDYIKSIGDIEETPKPSKDRKKL